MNIFTSWNKKHNKLNDIQHIYYKWKQRFHPGKEELLSTKNWSIRCIEREHHPLIIFSKRKNKNKACFTNLTKFVILRFSFSAFILFFFDSSTFHYNVFGVLNVSFKKRTDSFRTSRQTSCFDSLNIVLLKFCSMIFLTFQQQQNKSLVFSHRIN